MTETRYRLIISLCCPWNKNVSLTFACLNKVFAEVLCFFLLNFTERSRQSARECRARKKLRYQYLEELVADREKAVFALRKELERVRAHYFLSNCKIIRKLKDFCKLQKKCRT